MSYPTSHTSHSSRNCCPNRLTHNKTPLSIERYYCQTHFVYDFIIFRHLFRKRNNVAARSPRVFITLCYGNNSVQCTAYYYQFTISKSIETKMPSSTTGKSTGNSSNIRRVSDPSLLITKRLSKC